MENSNGKLKWKTQMENSVEKCRLFQQIQQNTQKADISLRSNILQSQMENSVEMCRLFQIVLRTIRLTGRNATKSQQNTQKADISLRSNIL